MPLRAALLLLLGGSGCFVSETQLEEALDRDGDGFLPVQAGGDDCDETRADVNPAAAEICGDGVDNDCDGVPDDDGFGSYTWFRDADNDGFGIAEETTTACSRPPGYAEVTGDCDDGDPAFNPAVDDLCDGLDQDCDGVPDDEVPLVERYYDGDSDGFGTLESAILTCQDDPSYVALVGDCDDADPTINPASIDLCDGIDQNCNGLIDEDSIGLTLFRDDDGDGYGIEAESTVACVRLPGFAPLPGDCDDTDGTVNPGAIDLCDAIDQNCNGQIDEDAVYVRHYYDADGDGTGDPNHVVDLCAAVSGYVLEGGDCDDGDPSVSPLIPDVCDGIDQDCDGVVDDDAVLFRYFADTDGDGAGDPATFVDACAAPSGYVLDDGDCDDGDASIQPGSVDPCDGIDQDCDGALDEDASFDIHFRDADGDGTGTSADTVLTCDGAPLGYVYVAGDCDDADPFVVVPRWYPDQDGDGHGAGTSVQQCAAPPSHVPSDDDCDDTDSDRSPALTEICRTGIDEDCDDATDCRWSGNIYLSSPDLTLPVPSGTTAVIAVGDVVGGPARDFVVHANSGAIVVDGGTDLRSPAATLQDQCAFARSADLDGDGRHDLVCSDPGILAVYVGGFSGTSVPDAVWYGDTRSPQPIELGMAGPGIWTRSNGQVVFIPYRQGANTPLPNDVLFTIDIDGVPTLGPPCGLDPQCVVVSDLQRMDMFPHDGGLVRTTADALWSLEGSPNYLITLLPSEASDLTGDGTPDLPYVFMDSVTPPSFGLYLTEGPVVAGSPSPGTLVRLPRPGDSVTTLFGGDYDGDGERDLVETATVAAVYFVYRFSFGVSTAPIDAGYSAAIVEDDDLIVPVTADFDQDGFDDFAMLDPVNNELRVIRGNGI